MKEYEAASSTFIDILKPFIVRLDGHSFSKYTKGFKRPFDERRAYGVMRVPGKISADL